ncbi:hypothetical protein NG800_006675 [Epilithonimonas ginsengisoli]|uniref:DUF4468 domain-containing protein n=1 Tax=Epilithonimonas ginsengisoli TaxID=1245592 RepID=A0ABU4JFY3_9FLAO|nr:MULTISPECIES: hypothetical protein [Chryseobacterium group]MBV6879216.1 hypothetical protein [Epilithonimonas sp. FP105]MDW8548587.1 hypothetical protein [Epilithonimonas ginsengisoli]OAH75462.1 hypothetical protein AXA65_03780 [Chryseobacterium sp. FP211-J200]
MNKTYFIFILFLSNKNFAQNGNANVTNNNTNREMLYMRSGYKSTIETAGSPYLYPEYKKASIAYNKTLVDMRYNAYKDEVEIISNNQSITIYKKLEYSPIHIIDSDEYIYLMEYPYDGKKVTGYLFEVRKNEEFTIFIKISKTYNKGRYAQDSFDIDKANSYEDLADVFYIKKTNEEIVQMPSTKKKLIELFPNKKIKIEQTIKENKLDSRKLNVLSQIFRALS